MKIYYRILSSIEHNLARLLVVQNSNMRSHQTCFRGVKGALLAFAVLPIAACDFGKASDFSADDIGGNGAMAGTDSGVAGSTPANGSVGTGCTPAPIEQTGVLLGRWGKQKLLLDGAEYLLQINHWNEEAPGEQALDYGGDFYFKMTRQTASAQTNGAPTGFPSIFIGANSGNMTQNSNLPKQVGALTRVSTTWNWSDNGTLADSAANSYNAVYDVWFSTTAQGDPDAYGPSAGYLMVWLYDPPDAQPIGGSARFSGVTVSGVPGKWDLWIGTNGGRPIINYVATQPMLSLSVDLNNFIKDAVQNRSGTVQNSWYLSNVFIGFEIWRGGVGLQTTSFCVEVE